MGLTILSILTLYKIESRLDMSDQDFKEMVDKLLKEVSNRYGNHIRNMLKNMLDLTVVTRGSS